MVSELIIACCVLWPGVPYRQQNWHTSQHAKPWRMWLGTTVTGALVAMPTLFLEGGGSKTTMGWGRTVLNIPSKIIAYMGPYKKM